MQCQKVAAPQDLDTEHVLDLRQVPVILAAEIDQQPVVRKLEKGIAFVFGGRRRGQCTDCQSRLRCGRFVPVAMVPTRRSVRKMPRAIVMAVVTKRTRRGPVKPRRALVSGGRYLPPEGQIGSKIGEPSL